MQGLAKNYIKCVKQSNTCRTKIPFYATFMNYQQLKQVDLGRNLSEVLLRGKVIRVRPDGCILAGMFRSLEKSRPVVVISTPLSTLMRAILLKGLESAVSKATTNFFYSVNNVCVSCAYVCTYLCQRWTIKNDTFQLVHESMKLLRNS